VKILHGGDSGECNACRLFVYANVIKKTMT
jgi:hypothetical protein